jgi:hypothetical protein
MNAAERIKGIFAEALKKKSPTEQCSSHSKEAL